MAKVYSNATITVAAVSSSNCYAGLHRTETSLFHAQELNLTIAPGEKRSWHRQHIETTQPMSFNRVIRLARQIGIARTRR
jgi:hypothetical protein